MSDREDGEQDDHDLIHSPDRRRPGRIKYVHPHLIALLRSSSRDSVASLRDSETEDALIESDRADDLRPAVGVAVSAMIGVVLWVALIWVTIKL